MSLTPRYEPETEEGSRENMRFFLARSGVMVWSLDIFTYVDDGMRRLGFESLVALYFLPIGKGNVLFRNYI